MKIIGWAWGFKFMGLKRARIRQWREVIQEEGRLTWRTWWNMAIAAIQATFHPVTRHTYTRRLLTCHRCPLYDRSLHRCRPYTGSTYGCGCFMPYKALSPSGTCWLNDRDPNQGYRS